MTERALATLSPTAAPLARDLGMDADRLALLSRTIGADLRPDELQLFLAVSARVQLDPFLKQIYPIKDNKSGRFYIHVGIDGRRVIGQRTGQVDGTHGPFWCGPDGEWHDAWLDETTLPVAAKFGILRKGSREPFWAVAHMRGFRSATGRWATDAVHMLGKVAEDHAWRKAFPYEMGALPNYRAEHDDPNTTNAEFREIDHDTGEVLPGLPEIANSQAVVTVEPPTTLQPHVSSTPTPTVQTSLTLWGHINRVRAEINGVDPSIVPAPPRKEATPTILQAWLDKFGTAWEQSTRNPRNQPDDEPPQEEPGEDI